MSHQRISSHSVYILLFVIIWVNLLVNFCVSILFLAMAFLLQYNPLKVWLYRGGFARFSNTRFSLDSIEDTCILILGKKERKTYFN